MPEEITPDAPPSDAPAPDAPPAGGAPPAPSDAPPTPTVPPPAPTAGEPPGGQKPPPTPYEVQLRDEVAGYRRQWEPIAKALGPLDDETRAGLLELAGLVATQDEDGVRARVAEAFGLDLPADVVDPRTLPVTRADLAAWQQHQTEERLVAQTQQSMRDEARAAGVEPLDAEGNPTSAYRHLVVLAGENPETPIADLVGVMLKDLEAYEQQVRDQQIQGKGGVRIPRPAGDAPGGTTEITDFAGAKAATMAALGAKPAV